MAANFQMHPDVAKWFSEIERPPVETKFEIFYYCLMAGFAARRAEQVPPGAVDFIDYYPGAFKTRGRLLVGLLLDAELKRRGIGLDEREAVNRNINSIVSPSSSVSLSTEGIRLMNQYAHGGWSALSEYFSDRPRTIETFVRTYARFIQDSLSA